MRLFSLPAIAAEAGAAAAAGLQALSSLRSRRDHGGSGSPAPSRAGFTQGFTRMAPTHSYKLHKAHWSSIWGKIMHKLGNKRMSPSHQALSWRDAPWVRRRTRNGTGNKERRWRWEWCAGTTEPKQSGNTKLQKAFGSFFSQLRSPEGNLSQVSKLLPSRLWWKPSTAFLQTDTPHSHMLAGAENFRKSCTKSQKSCKSWYLSYLEKRAGASSRRDNTVKQEEAESTGQIGVQRGSDICRSTLYNELRHRHSQTRGKLSP